MFGVRKTKAPQLLACLLRKDGYSLVGLESAERIRFYEDHYFNESSSIHFSKKLAEDVNKHHLIGQSCQVVLAPGLYELLLIDAPEVAENELSKALRWQLKGLVDYPLNDIAVDAFAVPPHGAGEKRKKAFVAATLQSELMSKVTIIESSLLHITSISISELALARFLSFEPSVIDAPAIVISFDDNICQLQIYYKDDLYLYRTLSISKTIIEPNSPANQDMLLEIQRSIDYCIMELKLTEPKQIFFTPSFYEATDLISFLQQELDKEVKLLNINEFLTSDPLPPEVMAKIFYAISGALMLSSGPSR